MTPSVHLLTSLLALTHALTGEDGTEPGLPLCDEVVLMPCINKAIVRFVRNTKGAAAAEGPPDAASSQQVAAAMSAQLGDPATDLNATCRTYSSMGMAEFADCLQTATAGCETRAPTAADDFHGDRLPSFGEPGLVEAVRTSVTMCTPGCLTSPVAATVAAMTACWTASETEVANAKKGATLEEDCSALDAYMQCQWSSSEGCLWLETVTRAHLVSLSDSIHLCNITLPPEALQAPVSTASRTKCRDMTQAGLFAVIVYGLRRYDLQ